MEFLKDLCLDMVNSPNCSGSDVVHLAYLLVSREDKNFVHESEPILWKDDANGMEEPF